MTLLERGIPAGNSDEPSPLPDLLVLQQPTEGSPGQCKDTPAVQSKSALPPRISYPHLKLGAFQPCTPFLASLVWLRISSDAPTGLDSRTICSLCERPDCVS